MRVRVIDDFVTAAWDKLLINAVVGPLGALTIRDISLMSRDDLRDAALVLADDAKVRSVLRLMLAGWLRLETPPHAAIATGLPLLVGGPRRLAHGVFSTLTKRSVSLPGKPTLPAPVAAPPAASAPAATATRT